MDSSRALLADDEEQPTQPSGCRCSPRYLVLLLSTAAASLVLSVLGTEPSHVMATLRATSLVSSADTVGRAAECEDQTSGTCYFFPCDASRGETFCNWGKCICKPGYCLQGGTCQRTPNSSFCQGDTGGTCRMLGCSDRGEVQSCGWGTGYHCLCKPGFCAEQATDHSGSQRTRCVGPDRCEVATGGTCHVFGCMESRGPTECVNGQCLCPKGFCSRSALSCNFQQDPFEAEVVAVNQTFPIFPARHRNLKSALCVSGGGGRAASFTLGAFRALSALGLLDRFDAISAVSGGAWAAAIYMFSNLTAEELLGSPRSASQLTFEELAKPPPRLGQVLTNGEEPFLSETMHRRLDAQNLWADFVAISLLKPLGLDKNASLMAASAEDEAEIKRRNPLLEDVGFQVPHPSRKQLLVLNGAILAPVGAAATKDTIVSLQMSPDFTGSPFFPDGRQRNINYPYSKQNVTLGGGFVETFAFGGGAPTPQTGGRSSMGAPAQPFTLAQALGITSAAFASPFASQAASVVAAQGRDVAPRIDTWPVGSVEQPTMTFEAGDGGSLENSGLLAMLQRRVEKVVWLINTDQPIASQAQFDWCGEHQHLDPFKKVTDQLTDKFGYGKDGDIYHLSKNQVFARARLQDIVCELQTKKEAGRPTVHFATLRVLPNAWWGITGNFDVDIAFIYNSRCTEFEAMLPPDVGLEVSKGARGGGGLFNKFPHYSTVFQNPLQLTALKNEQISLLAAQAEYFIASSWGMLQDMLEGEKKG